MRLEISTPRKRTMINAPIRTTLLLLSLTGLSGALFLLSLNATSALLAPQTAAGNADCAAASANTSFALSFVSYGNYTALPGQGEDPVPRQLLSMSFAAANPAHGVYTVCAFPLGRLADSADPATWVDDDSWQPCADRRDTDGKHRFTIATGAAFKRREGVLSVNQTWFCHDEEGRLVAYTGVAEGSLSITCADGGELGGYHVENCTAPDTVFPVTLL